MDAHRQEQTLSIGLLILRLGIGGYLLTHGVGRLQMLLAGQFEQMGDPIGLGNVLSLILVTISEFLCALLVMAGLATRPAAAIIVISMSVAAFAAHANDPWTMARAAELFFAGEVSYPASKEPALLFLIPCLALVFTGAGAFSLDALLRSRRQQPLRTPAE